MALSPGGLTDRYLEQLTVRDVALLCDAAGYPLHRDEADTNVFARQPDLLESALSGDAAYQRFLAPSGHRDPNGEPSPFLLFAVAVHRGVADLAQASFVSEPVAGHKRIPVFDTAVLRQHFADPYRRLFSVEHLASYTRVTSGPIWVQASNGRGRRRQRFSELDPTRLAAALDSVAPQDKPGIYRRLGDLALLLTGMFPDHTAKQPLHPITLERLLRSASIDGQPFQLEEVADLAGSSGLAGVLRRLGPRWYQLAANGTSLVGVRRLLHDAADGFDMARRFLTLVTDRYLFPLGQQWFPAPSPL